jgi:putative RecB family exonuclease
MTIIDKPAAPTGGELPKVLSPSRLADYKKCPKSFFFKSVARIPTKPSEPQVRGTVVHDVLEHLFTLPADQRDLNAALTELPEAMDRVWARPEYAELRADTDMAAHEISCVKHLENYFTIENPTKFTPDSTEEKVFGEVDGYPVMGIIDRLDTVTRDQGTSVYVSDYKTGKIPKTRYEDEAFSAMRFYAMLLTDSGIKPDVLRLVYLSKPGKTSVLKRPVTDEVIDATRKENVAVIRSIRSAHANDNWPATTGPLCPWCDYQSICPAFSGDGAATPTEIRLNPW